METLYPTMQFRYLKRIKEDLGITIVYELVLQQKFVSRIYEKEYWLDVPIVEEEIKK